MANKRTLIGVVLGVVVLLVTVFLVLYYTNSFSPSFKADELTDFSQSTNVIAKVGSEELYEKDLLYELSMHPQKNDPKTRTVILNKMITDSIMLQAAKDDGHILLDSSIFNSPSMNYQKRIQTIASIPDLVDAKPDTIEGYVVAIWFRNNDYIGPLGLERSKQTAFEKLKSLHTEVAAGRMTIQQAGQIISNDASLETLDKAYKNNAIFDFKAQRGDKPITLHKPLDDALWNAKQDGVTDIFLGTGVSEKTDERYEAVYYFGQVTSRKVSGSSSMPFDKWLESKRQIYVVEIK